MNEKQCYYISYILDTDKPNHRHSSYEFAYSSTDVIKKLLQEKPNVIQVLECTHQGTEKQFRNQLSGSD